jgi:hypothetical protein
MHAMKAYGGVVVELHSFLTSALDEGDWLVSLTGRFNPGERAICTHCLRSWVGPSAGPDASEKIKNICHCWQSNHDPSVIKPEAWSLCRIRYDGPCLTF